MGTSVNTCVSAFGLMRICVCIIHSLCLSWCVCVHMLHLCVVFFTKNKCLNAYNRHSHVFVCAPLMCKYMHTCREKYSLYKQAPPPPSKKPRVI